MEKVVNVSKKELQEIKAIIGEAFISNELFHEFGDIESRRDSGLAYMEAYVHCVYESGLLYRTKDKKGYIGLAFAGEERFLPKIKMLGKMLKWIPFAKLKKLLHFVRQVSDGNRQYQKQPHIDVLLVCVDKMYQGQGIAGKLVEYAKEMSQEKEALLLFDTDMEDYAKMYQHMGCSLYNTITADNGVTRYNLVWKGNRNDG